MAVKRFGVSLEDDLLEKLDGIVEGQRFPNRSQAIRHLIVEHKTQQGFDPEQKVTGAVVLVYDHRVKRLHTEIVALQHEYNCMAVTSTHVHIDEKNCIENIVVKGTAKNIIKLSNKLQAIKGIRQGNLVITAIE